MQQKKLFFVGLASFLLVWKGMILWKLFVMMRKLKKYLGLNWLIMNWLHVYWINVNQTICSFIYFWPNYSVLTKNLLIFNWFQSMYRLKWNFFDLVNQNKTKCFYFNQFYSILEIEKNCFDALKQTATPILPSLKESPLNWNFFKSDPYLQQYFCCISIS